MCKSSQEAKLSVRAEAGVQYEVAKTSGGLAGLALKSGSTSDVIACFHTKDKITLANIPPTVQQQYGIGPVVFAEFEMTGHDRQDQLIISSGAKAATSFWWKKKLLQKIPLSGFVGHGVLAYFGHVDQKARDAIAKAARDDGDGGTVIERKRLLAHV